MHEKYMKLAIQEAKRGFGRTLTNPLVGAVIVNNQKVIAKGAHLEYGKEHAEKNALSSYKAPNKQFDSILYVTLEPCNHYGKQPPCTQEIINSGIKQVVIGQLDPNPLVSGKGKETLEQNGIKVITGVLETEVRELNPFFNCFYEQNRPYITLKQAITLDGKLSLFSERTAITGEDTYKYVRKERDHYQGILVGSQTVLTDNPFLLGSGQGLHPIRMVLDRRGRLFNQLDLNIFTNQASPVWIFTEQKVELSLPEHVDLIFKKNITIESVIDELVKRNIQSLYVEGGAKIHDSFLNSGYWDELITYISPKIIGGNGVPAMSSTRNANRLIELRNVNVEFIDQDIRVSGRRC
ncbi:bifunctional diaminohydroxyphosphoribosylaminopyrimidine deaminase/5-amino-6-(5-phosphoribosylamino)uracil reductase RibD [Amphibacillus sp. MSJ-3]|uniref:bifunctional diaminohydroxyphosphoribosylaminopyrimidine deaminase/5-amino-6-(5-phosphoribosylamino)uracil reductase RibD n=1 Tax=Amphibacillus sp. MSJ-3 TaxID=2841505 RepID=UPI001C0F090A|nr:bifunctional diaminohydroxyphosphoribosylaminopyrimidine deaminase/5-amino-6-(5-phosphoribosylamino)uracil reductase RibD [Amphibacillus sp. MSJ-3]MBU5593869.1 bifunctional diaminohydroxyphosphoribosylaminopyrimidine deaminase/5-amino-6-(5-phosphoribosylamino)uracil reductase RibD [Amphibacillus sp. MSJ-3]